MADHANQPNTSRQSGVVPAGFQYDVVETSSPTINVIHGKGVVTAVPIQLGALILEEAPFVCLGSNDFNVPQSVISHPQWQRLPARSSSPFRHGVYHDKFMANSLRCGRSRIPNSTAEDDLSGFFPDGSRFNSSCAPNVHAHWNAKRGTMQFRAMRPINQWEELCICYDVNALLCTKKARQQRLRDGYGFVCSCPSCSQTTAETRLSDDQRCCHREIIEKGGRSVENAEEAIINAVRGLRNEGLHHYGDTLHYDLYLAWSRTDRNNAMLCLLTARNLACAMVGKDDERVRNMTALLPSPWREDYSSDCRAVCCNLVNSLPPHGSGG